jgi:uncharacterized protein YbjT (DUF2867 family)
VAEDGRLVLVTGATGYIGGRLLRPLAAEGFRVRAGARQPAVLEQRWGSLVEPVRLDVFDAASVRSALAGVDTAFYLVHSLGGSAEYARLDRVAARTFARAAREAGVRRVVYLGGLGDDSQRLSEHLGSRHEVGGILAQEGPQTLEFRASIVIGSGSTSFEMIRNLVEKLPAMTTPSWVRMPAQPIAIEDVVRYLVTAVSASVTGNHIFEIGGTEIVTYGDILRRYADRRGLKRLIIPVPFLTPWLSGWWLSLFTPAQARVGRQLAESLRFPTVVTDDAAVRTFPEVVPMGLDDAFDRALANEDTEAAETRWCDSLGSCQLVEPPKRERLRGRLIDERSIRVNCPPEAAFAPIVRIGGSTGWYSADWLWGLRGWLDQFVGGVGSRRGRRHPTDLRPGDTLDWWRVVSIEPPHSLLLQAEMRIPGRGWLRYDIEPDPDTGGSIVNQTAIFDSKGLLGLGYWYALVPFHAFVFNGVLRGIERECGRL